MENGHYIWALISDKLSGEASESRLKELEELQLKKPEIKQLIQLLENIWNSSNNNNERYRKESFVRHLRRLGQNYADLPLEKLLEEFKM